VNNVNIDGRMVKKAEIRQTTNSQVAEFTIANKSGWGDNEKTSFFDVKIWGKQADFVVNYFEKGDGINIAGDLIQESWTNKDGDKRSKVVIVASRASFPLSRPSQGQGGGTQGGGQKTQEKAPDRFSATPGDLPDDF